MPILKNKKGVPSWQHKPSDFFRSHKKVAEALLTCLEENDASAFLEILDAYLNVNRTKVAKDTKLSRTTIQSALSKEGNPTIRTIAKIVHHSVS
jgi:probable addiction module antidote protein